MRHKVRKSAELVLNKGSLHATWWVSVGWGYRRVYFNLACMELTHLTWFECDFRAEQGNGSLPLLNTKLLTVSKRQSKWVLSTYPPISFPFSGFSTPPPPPLPPPFFFVLFLLSIQDPVVICRAEPNNSNKNQNTRLFMRLYLDYEDTTKGRFLFCYKSLSCREFFFM